MSTIHLFHGLTENPIKNEPKAPLFMTSSREVAENLSLFGKVVVVTTDNNNFLDLTDNDQPAIDYLKKVGVDIQELPFFYCEAITHHSSNDGTNVIDLAYLPEFQTMVASKGFKGVKMTNLYYNKAYTTYILFDTSVCKIVDSDRVENEEVEQKDYVIA